MPDLMVVLAGGSPCAQPTTLRQLGRVIEARLAISGRVPMQGLARWSSKGGSYRTIQRWFKTPLNGLHLTWLLIRHHVWEGDEVAWMRGEHVGVTQSGQTTHGGDRFVSSLDGQAVPSLCFVRLSLLSVKPRTSSPVVTEQGDKPLERLGQAAPKPKKRSGGSRGRPKGSKNRHRREVDRRPLLGFIQRHLERLLEQMGDTFKGVYVICDGE